MITSPAKATAAEQWIAKTCDSRPSSSGAYLGTQRHTVTRSVSSPRSIRSSSTSRYDRENRKYQPTAIRMTAGSLCRHLKIAGSDFANLRPYQLPLFQLQHFRCMIAVSTRQHFDRVSERDWISQIPSTHHQIPNESFMAGRACQNIEHGPSTPSKRDHIGSVDPDALKIPARRAEYSLTESALSLHFTLNQHKRG
jgi:hypothetical protein